LKDASLPTSSISAAPKGRMANAPINRRE
jgi:hypothetical protein